MVSTQYEGEVNKAVRKKVIIKSPSHKKLVDDFDFSVYGARRQSRIYAMSALYSYEANNSDILLENLLKFEYEEREIFENVLVFAKTLIKGTIENIKVIDKIIEKYSENWDITRIQCVDKAIIRISIYSMLYQPDVPRSVIIDEAIEIAKIFSDKDSYKFINGILDGIQKLDIEEAKN